jgi:hypothetical protein
MSEHHEQCAIFEWARLHEGAYPELFLLHMIPNGAKLPFTKRGKKRISQEAIKLKKEGMKAGVPDMCLPVARQGYHGLYIELKFGKNKPTDKQVIWLTKLSQQGYLASAVWGACDAIKMIVEYLDMDGSAIPWDCR